MFSGSVAGTELFAGGACEDPCRWMRGGWCLWRVGPLVAISFHAFFKSSTKQLYLGSGYNRTQAAANSLEFVGAAVNFFIPQAGSGKNSHARDAAWGGGKDLQ